MVIRILFLTANPTDLAFLRLDKESRAIDHSLRSTDFRDKFEFIQHHAVQTKDIQEYLLRYKPHIVHFSGHGDVAGNIFLETDKGLYQPVSIKSLSNLFSILNDNIRCVVLSACFSKGQAEAIAEHVDCVIGIPGMIGDESAINFASAFYRGIGFGRSIETAFYLGCSQIDLDNPDLDKEYKPQLIALICKPSEIILPIANPSKGSILYPQLFRKFLHNKIFIFSLGLLILLSVSLSQVFRREEIPISSYLDTAAGAIRSQIVLDKDKSYTVAISGTWSTWDATWWSAVCKGTPEALPQKSTPNRTNGNVGLDAAFIFARPKRSSYCGQNEILPAPLSPLIQIAVSLDNGGSWQTLESTNLTYNTQHVYHYTIVGQGFPAQFRVQEKTPEDNYGILTVEIEKSLKP